MPSTPNASEASAHSAEPESPSIRPAKRRKVSQTAQPIAPSLAAPIVLQTAVSLSPVKSATPWPGTTTADDPPKKRRQAIPGGLGYNDAPLYQYPASSSALPTIVNWRKSRFHPFSSEHSSDIVSA